jgi:predicted PolB exonuclease-like 3'-5' exonuclease
VKYLIFDVESVADGGLVSRIRYPGEKLSGDEAIQRYREELIEKYETDFIPYTFQIPVSVVAAKIGADFRIIDLVALDEPQFRSHVITEKFWRGWEAYRHPTLVSFNGRTFDLPLLELAAFRYGLNLSYWFNLQAKSWEQQRNRYNTQAHLDLHDVLTNFGATRFNGGLNLVANLIGKPGKMDVQGYMVQDLFNEGKLAEINEYCRCDVLDTYFAFLRTNVLIGNLPLDKEQRIVDETKEWLAERADQCPAYRSYLEDWGDWNNPWLDDPSGQVAASSEATN